MIQPDLAFLASLDPRILDHDFGRLFVGGRISDSDLDRRVIKLSRQFKVFATTCHLPLWTNGLVVTDELCRTTETYLEYDGIRSSLLRLVRLSLKGVFAVPPLLAKADAWVRLLQALNVRNAFANPATFIAHLAGNEADRLRFLFSIYLPDQYGGGFGRYPGQMGFIRRWVSERHSYRRDPVSCLDAACGSGEGSYELAGLLMGSGVDIPRIRITGITLNPLEVFAAAHAYFPHAPEREARYREVVSSLAEAGTIPLIDFRTTDLKVWNPPGRYDIVLCNGFLGGPMLHDPEDVEDVVVRLVAGLRHGGVLLAADRFHGGWKKAFPGQRLETIFTKCGLELLSVPEGVAGVRR